MPNSSSSSTVPNVFSVKALFQPAYAKSGSFAKKTSLMGTALRAQEFFHKHP